MATRKKVEASTPAEQETTAAQKIWNKIKDLSIDIFALPNQSVQDHVKREVGLERAIPDAVHLILKSAAVRPALEETLGRVRLGQNNLGQPLVFELTTSGKYTVVKIVPRDS
jgi:hypothetical protein